MASTRIENSQIFSCKFSLCHPNIVSCTSTLSNELYGPGRLCFYKISDTKHLGHRRTIPWKCALLDHCWSLKEDVVCASSSDGELLLWKLSQTSHTPIAGYVQHKGGIATVIWKKENPNAIVSGSVDGTVKFWDITKKHAVHNCDLKEAILQLSYNSVSSITVAVLANRRIALIDEKSGSNFIQLQYENILSCDWSSLDFNTMFTARADGSVCMIDIRHTKGVPRFVVSHNGPVRRIKEIPSLHNITISAGFDGNTVITDVSGGKVLETISHHSNIVYDVDCSQFNPILMDCSWDSLLHVFESQALHRRNYSFLNKL